MSWGYFEQSELFLSKSTLEQFFIDGQKKWKSGFDWNIEPKRKRRRKRRQKKISALKKIGFDVHRKAVWNPLGTFTRFILFLFTLSSLRRYFPPSSSRFFPSFFLSLSYHLMFVKDFLSFPSVCQANEMRFGWWSGPFRCLEGMKCRQEISRGSFVFCLLLLGHFCWGTYFCTTTVSILRIRSLLPKCFYLLQSITLLKCESSTSFHLSLFFCQGSDTLSCVIIEKSFLKNIAALKWNIYTNICISRREK